jgi:hypothetical protein
MEPSPRSHNDYLDDIPAFPVLSLEMEQELCLRWRDHISPLRAGW